MATLFFFFNPFPVYAWVTLRAVPALRSLPLLCLAVLFGKEKTREGLKIFQRAFGMGSGEKLQFPACN
jgi:hypothetical protein